MDSIVLAAVAHRATAASDAEVQAGGAGQIVRYSGIDTPPITFNQEWPRRTAGGVRRLPLTLCLLTTS